MSSTETRDRRVALDGRTFAWREHGAGPSIVLLHGIGSSAQSWDGVAQRLARDYRLLAWETPGYGSADDLPGNGSTVEDYVDALFAWLDAIGVAPYAIVGQSLGSLIAAFALARGKLPVARAVLLSVARGNARLGPDESARRLRERIDDFDRSGRERYAAERAPKLLSKNAGRETIDRATRIMAALRPEGFHRAATMLATSDVFAAAPHIRVPTLVACGTDDTVTPLEQTREVAAAIDGAAFVEFPGAGHAAHLEFPDAVAHRLSAFLNPGGA